MNRTSGLALVALIALAACGGGGGTASSGASAGPAAAESAAPASASTAAQSPAAPGSPGLTPTPEPTPTLDPNLLSYANGTHVVSYPAAMESDPDDVVDRGISVNDGAKGPFVVVYELPTVETITGFDFKLDRAPEGAKPSATVATSTTSATDGFADVGTVTAGSEDSSPTLKAGVKARWVRLTYASPDGRGLNGFSATGAAPGPRTGAPVGGIYIEHDGPHAYKDGGYAGTDTSDDPWLVRAVPVGDGLSLVHCYATKTGKTSTGTMIDGRAYEYKHDNRDGRLVVNDEGTLMVGREGGGAMHYVATTLHPKFCDPEKPYGTGSNRLLVLDAESHSDPYPLSGYEDQLKKYRITRMPAGMVDAAALAAADMAILNGVCVSSEYLSPAQGKLLADWVFAGHKVAMYDSDMCGATTRYDFLPYQFVTSNPGAGGAHGDRLIEVESNDLGSLDPSDTKRFLDATAYAKDEANQLGDANTTISKDDHWCGHLFGTNSQKVNGFMQMYAPYGKGVFIYDGFDQDDGSVPGYQRARDLELGLTLPADLPCTVKVDMSFVLQPNRDATFVAGKAATLPFAMEVLANQGWKGHVTVGTQGGFPTDVTPTSFDMDGGTQPLQLSVKIPAGTKAGTYAVTVTATDPSGKTSQAVIQLSAEAPLKKIPKRQRRIRLYGIHFDYDSARIQPRSEPVIKEIADLMKADRTLRFQVEGHTDSDGGAAYNLKLSQARAASVVADLIHRYHIAASRLVPKGFGLTHPVASNATAGGKALNRRVELLRL